MIDGFILMAMGIGVGFSMLAGPLGSVMVWRRLSFLGDTIAHATLLGIATALALNLNIFFVCLTLCVLISMSMIGYRGSGTSKSKSHDARLALISHGALALGVLGLSLQKTPITVINAVLFGDILSVGPADLGFIFALAFILVGLLKVFWRQVLSVLISEDMAICHGINVTVVKLGFALVLGLTIGVALKLIGALLLTALLIIPALAARPFAKTPMQMMIAATIIGILSFAVGLFMSYGLDTPAGPSIVTAALLAYVSTKLIFSLLKPNVY